MPVGGLREKLIAAALHLSPFPIKILVPYANRPEIEMEVIPLLGNVLKTVSDNRTLVALTGGKENSQGNDEDSRRIEIVYIRTIKEALVEIFGSAAEDTLIHVRARL